MKVKVRSESTDLALCVEFNPLVVFRVFLCLQAWGGGEVSARNACEPRFEGTAKRAGQPAGYPGGGHGKCECGVEGAGLRSGG